MNFTRPQNLFSRFNGNCAPTCRRLVAAIALFAGISTSSSYGADYSTPRVLPDYSLRGPTIPASSAPVFPSWGGFYFGAQAGQTFGSADFSNGTSSMVSYILANTELQDIVSNWTTMPKNSSASRSFGGFVGYNYQWGEVITGLELNYNHLSFGTSARDSAGPIQVAGAALADGSTVLYNVTVASTASVAISDILTARLRAGWAFDRLLPYGFVGFAAGRADVTQTASVTGTKSTQGPSVTNTLTGVVTTPAPVVGTLNLPRNPQSQSKVGQAVYGFTTGLGIEVGVLPNVFLRAEWELIQFPNISDIRVLMNTARVGVALKF